MLPHGKKASSVDAIICVATHSGSHSLHGPTSPMGTSMRAIRRDWQLRLLKRERPGNSMTETGTVSALSPKKFKFHGQIASLSFLQCTTCSEKFPGFRLGRGSTECMHCSQDKHIPKLYSPANNMDPGAIPPQQPVVMFHNFL